MTADDVYRRQNLGNASGIGARCALVLVDFVNGFVDVAQFGGPHIAAAVQATRPLLAAFRAAGLPSSTPASCLPPMGLTRTCFA